MMTSSWDIFFIYLKILISLHNPAESFSGTFLGRHTVMRTNTNFIVLQSLVISLTLTGCLSSGGGGDSAGTDGGGGNTPSAKANISGTVTGNASSGSYGSLAWMPQALRKLAAKISTQSAADGCAAGSFTGSFVGEGSTSAVSGTFSSGTFEIPDVVQGKELVLTFNCDDTTTQRCLVKSGDTGVKCDPIADSVIDAIEDSLAKNMTDASLAGKSLAKISSAIVQSVSTEDTSSESLREALLACKSLSGQAKATCIREAFASSNTAGTLKMAETLANGWTVDAIFTLLVDVYGARIGIDNFIYSSMATNLDSWIGTDFVAQTRTYLNSVITAQLSGTSNYVTKVECRLWYSKFQSGGQISYSPTMVTKDGLSQPLCKNDVALALNGLSPTQITNLYTGMANPMHQGIDLNGNAMPVDCNNAWKIPGAFCAWPPELVITSKFVEPNRNDPTGEHEEFYEAPRVELIGAFPELEQAIMTAMQTGPSGCLSMVPNGGPALNPTTECETWFGPIMAQQKKNFGGLMGLYLFLKGTNTGSLLSLDDIHRLFSKSNFMNMRLALRGHNACGSRVTDPDSGNSNHIPALAKFNPTTGLFNAQNGLSCNMDSSQAMTLESAQTAINDAQVPYSVSFSMFENIPSAVEINKFVFGAGTHSPWNPTGSRQFWAAGFKYSGSTFPILCRMLKKDNINNLIPKEGELDDKTVISCLTGTELAALTPPAEPPNTDGIMVLPKGYPYVLMNYGYQGDGKGSIFALADAKSGREIRIGEQPVLIQQLHSGNVNQCDGVTQTNGKVFKANLNMGFGDGTRSQASKVYCLDMSAFQETGSYFIYHGGMLSIKQVNDDGTSWTWMAPQVGVRNPTSPSQTLLPVCYFLSASDPGFDTNATTRLTTSTSLNSTTGELSSIGTNDAIDFCEKADLHVGATKYYLVMMGGWMNNDRTSLKMGLIGSETGARMLQFRNWSDANVTSWEDLHI